MHITYIFVNEFIPEIFRDIFYLNLFQIIFHRIKKKNWFKINIRNRQFIIFANDPFLDFSIHAFYFSVIISENWKFNLGGAIIGREFKCLNEEHWYLFCKFEFKITKLRDIEHFIIFVQNLCKFICFREVQRLQRKSARLRLWSD